MFLRVESERAADLARELAEAASLSRGGLDKGGLWALADQMAGAVAAAPPTRASHVQGGTRAARRLRRRRR